MELILLIIIIFIVDDWLILTFFGDRYTSHCGRARRKVLLMIHCDRLADTHVTKCDLLDL